MIKLYRLTTGEDVIGTFEDHTDLFEHVKKPYVLIPMQGQPGQPMQIGFHPYLPYSKDEVVKLKKVNIICEATPTENIVEAYQKNTGSIVTPKKSIIT